MFFFFIEKNSKPCTVHNGTCPNLRGLCLTFTFLLQLFSSYQIPSDVSPLQLTNVHERKSCLKF